MKVVVSILHYNTPNETIDCVDSMLKLVAEDISFETVILDNGSTTPFLIDTKKYKSINLKLIRSETNLGFTGGHNLVYDTNKNSDFDYFLILNNDIILHPRSIKSLLDTFKETNVGAVVPKIYFTKGREYHKTRYSSKELGNVIWYAGGNIDWKNVTSRHIGVDEVDAGQFDKKTEIKFATGACLLIKKEVIDKIGLFDKRYFLYYEDADLSVRILRAKYKLIYQPESIVWHNNASSSGSGSDLHDYYLSRNKMIFGMKYASPIVRIHLVKESLRLLRYGRKWQKRGVLDYFKKNFGKGTYAK